MGKRNPVAQALRRLKPQVVKPRKGKASYSRKSQPLRGATIEG